MLANLSDPLVQKTLNSIFPGNKVGSFYRLPTEAEWEFTARLGGVAEGDYSFGNSETELNDYTVNIYNSQKLLSSVGLKKPVFYNGKPIYDLQGNAWVWVSDLFQSKLQGGIDPKGAIHATSGVVRGGGWYNSATDEFLTIGKRDDHNLSTPNNVFGFRLVRNID
jgi:formylglycine-generating enzyme required for sulfatase activity